MEPEGSIAAADFGNKLILNHMTTKFSEHKRENSVRIWPQRLHLIAHFIIMQKQM